MRYRTFDEILSVSPEQRVLDVFVATFGKELGAILAHELSASPEYSERYQQMVENCREHQEKIRVLRDSLRTPVAYELSITLTVSWGANCGKKFAPEPCGRYNRFWKARLAKWWKEFNDHRFPREYTITPIYEPENDKNNENSN